MSCGLVWPWRGLFGWFPGALFDLKFRISLGFLHLPLLETLSKSIVIEVPVFEFGIFGEEMRLYVALHLTKMSPRKLESAGFSEFIGRNNEMAGVRVPREHGRRPADARPVLPNSWSPGHKCPPFRSLGARWEAA
jgi:hypothetical protein